MTVVVGAIVFAAEVKLPAMKTRAALPVPTTSMSQISPVLMRGVLVRGRSGTRRLCPGAAVRAGGAVGLAVRVVGADASPWLSVTVSVIVFAPAVA